MGRSRRPGLYAPTTEEDWTKVVAAFRPRFEEIEPEVSYLSAPSQICLAFRRKTESTIRSLRVPLTEAQRNLDCRADGPRRQIAPTLSLCTCILMGRWMEVDSIERSSRYHRHDASDARFQPGGRLPEFFPK